VVGDLAKMVGYPVGLWWRWQNWQRGEVYWREKIEVRRQKTRRQKTEDKKTEDKKTRRQKTRRQKTRRQKTRRQKTRRQEDRKRASRAVRCYTRNDQLKPSRRDACV
jgi:hypothetical protein